MVLKSRVGSRLLFFFFVPKVALENYKSCAGKLCRKLRFSKVVQKVALFAKSCAEKLRFSSKVVQKNCAFHQKLCKKVGVSPKVTLILKSCAKLQKLRRKLCKISKVAKSWATP